MGAKEKELAELIARCTTQDQQALNTLFNTVGGYLNSVIFRILKCDDASNEVLQEVFIQIWKNASSYKPHLVTPLPWMTSIARYRSLDRLEKEKRYTQRFDLNEEYIERSQAEEQFKPDAALQNLQLDNQIHSCLGLLNEKVGASIKLAYLDGYSREEIAEKLGTKTNTVKSWLRRGSQRLKQCLESKNNDTNTATALSNMSAGR